MKKFIIIVKNTLVLTPIILVYSALFINHPDFSGDWKLNESKSELGNFGARLASLEIKIVQHKDSITLTKTHPNGGVDTETLSYDGKESDMPMTRGSGRKKSTAKWSDDGQFFIVKFVINTQNGIVTGTQTWSLKESKLYVESAYSTPQQGNFTIKAVYDKQ